jgi:hypothetical protein
VRRRKCANQPKERSTPPCRGSRKAFLGNGQLDDFQANAVCGLLDASSPCCIRRQRPLRWPYCCLLNNWSTWTRSCLSAAVTCKASECPKVRPPCGSCCLCVVCPHHRSVAFWAGLQLQLSKKAALGCLFRPSAPLFYSKLWSRVVASNLAQRAALRLLIDCVPGW